MKELDLKEYELVALGAAIASNCVPCIEYHVPEARRAGLTDAQIHEAVEVANKIRQVPARKVLDAAWELVKPGKRLEEATAPGPPASCGCAVPAGKSGTGCC